MGGYYGSNTHYKIVQTIKKWHNQSLNCSTFYTGIGQCKMLRNGLAKTQTD